MSASAGSFEVYILENEQGRFYIGSTDDLTRRVQQHNDPTRDKTKYTAKHGPWKLAWSESHSTRAEAMARERQINRMKSAKWIRENVLQQNPLPAQTGRASPDTSGLAARS